MGGHGDEKRAARLLMEGSWRAALSEVAQLVLALPAEHPRRAVALATLAHVYAQLGRSERARVCAERALELEPRLREAELVLARVR